MDRRTQSAWDHAAATWPTLHGTAKEEYERRQGPTANELGNLVNRTAAAWPTPQSRDEKGQTQNANRQDATPNVVKGIHWPTPRNNTGPSTDAKHLSIDGVLGKTQYGCLAQTESFVVRLMTLSSWLMGYTAHYLRHWEIRSVRKSRQKSLKE